MVKFAYGEPDIGGLRQAVTRCLWSHLTDLCLWIWCTSLAKRQHCKDFYKMTSEDTCVQHGLHCIFKCVAELQLFLLFLSVLSFGLLYGSFYNEVVLCDDQKLWCCSIVFKYLMSLKYGLKSVWTSDSTLLTLSVFLKSSIIYWAV